MKDAILKGLLGLAGAVIVEGLAAMIGMLRIQGVTQSASTALAKESDYFVAPLWVAIVVAVACGLFVFLRTLVAYRAQPRGELREMPKRDPE